MRALQEAGPAADAGQPIAEADESGTAGADPAAAAAAGEIGFGYGDVCSSEVMLEMLPETPSATASSGMHAGRHGSATGRRSSATGRRSASSTGGCAFPVSTSAVDNAGADVDMEAGGRAGGVAGVGASAHGCRKGDDSDSGDDGKSTDGAINRAGSAALTAPSGPSMTRASLSGSSGSMLDFLRWWEPPARVRAALSTDVSRRHVHAASRSRHTSGGDDSHDEGVVTGVPLRVLGVHRSNTVRRGGQGGTAACEALVWHGQDAIADERVGNAAAVREA